MSSIQDTPTASDRGADKLVKASRWYLRGEVVLGALALAGAAAAWLLRS